MPLRFIVLLATCGYVAAALSTWSSNANGFSTSAQPRRRSYPVSLNISSTVMISTWPSVITLGATPFETAVFDGNLVWLIPRSASHIVFLDPIASDAMTALALPADPTSPDKFNGAAYDGEGAIWLPPYGGGFFMVINVTTRTAASLSDPSLDGSQSYHGASFDGEYVWCAPFSSSILLRIDRRQKKGASMMPAPFRATNAPSNYFTGIVFDGRRMWLVTGRANNLLAIDTTSLNVTSLTAWPAGTWQPNVYNFVGGCFDGARVWLAPDEALGAVYVDVVAMMISPLPLPSMISPSAFRSAFFDGIRVWLMPRNADSFVAIDPPSGISAPTWKAYRSKVSARGGAVSDGRYLYVVPFFSGSPTALMKLPLNRTKRTRTVTLSVAATTSRTPSPATSASRSPSSTPSSSSPSHLASPATVTLSVHRTSTCSSSQSTASASTTKSLVIHANRVVIKPRVTPSASVTHSTSASATVSRTVTLSLSFTVAATITTASASTSVSRVRRQSKALMTFSTSATVRATASVSRRGGLPEGQSVFSRETAIAAVSISFVASTATLGNPGAGANAGRVRSLLTLASCSPDANPAAPQEPLDWSSSPTCLSIESAGPASRYDAGLVVGNAAIAFIVVALHFSLAGGHRCWMSQRVSVDDTVHSTAPWTLQRSLAWAWFPSFSAPLHAVLLSLISQSAAACIARGSRGAGVLGVSALTLIIGLAAWHLYFTARVVPRTLCTVPSLRKSATAVLECRARVLEVLFDEREVWEWRLSSADGGHSNQHHEELSVMLLSSDEAALQRDAAERAADNAEQYLRSYGSYFEDYVYRARWWFGVELVIGTLSGVAAGINGAVVSCAMAAWAGLAPAVAYLVLVLAVRPHQRLADFVASVITGFVLLVGSLAAALNVTVSGASPESGTLAAWCAVVASLAQLVPMVFLPVRVHRAARKRRDRAKAAAEARDRIGHPALSLEPVLRSPMVCGESATPSLVLPTSISSDRSIEAHSSQSAAVKEVPRSGVLTSRGFGLMDGEEADALPLLRHFSVRNTGVHGHNLHQHLHHDLDDLLT